MLVVGKADTSPDNHCIYTIDDYLSDSYGVDKSKVNYAVFPENQAVCLAHDLCMVCKDKKWQEQSDLTACRGLRCYPN